MASKKLIAITAIIIGVFVLVAGGLLVLSLNTTGAFAATIPQNNALAQLDSPTLTYQYGQPIGALSFAPVPPPASASAFCPNVYDYGAITIPDYTIVIDGIGYSPTLSGYNNQLGITQVLGGTSYLNFSPAFLSPVPAMPGVSFTPVSSALITPPPTANFQVALVSIPQYLLPGQHDVKIYQQTGSISKSEDTRLFADSRRCNIAQVLQTGPAPPFYGAANVQTTFSEFTINVLNSTTSCTGNTQGGVCQVPLYANGCAPGQTTDGHYCYYALTPTSNYQNSAQLAAQLAAYQNTTSALNAQNAYLQSQLTAAQSVPAPQANQTLILALQANITALQAQIASAQNATAQIAAQQPPANMPSAQTPPAVSSTAPPAGAGINWLCIIPIAGLLLIIFGAALSMKGRR